MINRRLSMFPRCWAIDHINPILICKLFEFVLPGSRQNSGIFPLEQARRDIVIVVDPQNW